LDELVVRVLSPEVLDVSVEVGALVGTRDSDVDVFRFRDGRGVVGEEALDVLDTIESKVAWRTQGLDPPLGSPLAQTFVGDAIFLPDLRTLEVLGHEMVEEVGIGCASLV
jgi:hypothetical protein